MFVGWGLGSLIWLKVLKDVIINYVFGILVWDMNVGFYMLVSIFYFYKFFGL